MNIREWSLARRLGSSFAALLVMMIALVAINTVNLQRTDEALRSLYADRAGPLKELGEVVYLTTRNRLLMMDVVDKRDAALKARRLEEIANNRARQDKMWAHYLTSAMDAEEKSAAEALTTALERYDKEALAPTLKAIEAEQWDAAKALLDGKVAQTNPPLVKAAADLSDFQVKAAAQEFTQATADSRRLKTVMFVLTAVSLLAGAWLAVGLTRSVVGKLGAEPDDLARCAQRIAAGDLTDDGRPAAAAGSVMASMQAMRAALRGIVGTVRHGVESVACASAQIAQGNLDLSSRTETQASSLQQTSTAMEQLTATVNQSAENAREAAQLATRASGVATHGGSKVEEVVQTMDQIQASSRKIADITGVIDGIAFQTNILALNAAVEAARAGEQGRGFAVVAGEVRILAQRSAEAARQIKGLISASVEKVEAGGVLVADAGVTMQDIVAQVKRVNELVAQITGASTEQSLGISQVSRAVTDLDQTTQQNAALVEQSAAAAASLKSQADKLAEAVAVFKLA